MLVKVLDFGIAKLLTEPERAPSTHTGTLLGTPIYIAPERLRGDPHDGRADIYSVGMLAYQLLAGRTHGQLAELLASEAPTREPLEEDALGRTLDPHDTLLAATDAPSEADTRKY